MKILKQVMSELAQEVLIGSPTNYKTIVKLLQHKIQMIVKIVLAAIQTQEVVVTLILK